MKSTAGCFRKASATETRRLCPPARDTHQQPTFINATIVLLQVPRRRALFLMCEVPLYGAQGTREKVRPRPERLPHRTSAHISSFMEPSTCQPNPTKRNGEMAHLVGAGLPSEGGPCCNSGVVVAGRDSSDGWGRGILDTRTPISFRKRERERERERERDAGRQGWGVRRDLLYTLAPSLARG